MLSQNNVLCGLHCSPSFFVVVLLRFLNDETSKPELLVTPKLARPGEVGIGLWNRSSVLMDYVGKLQMENVNEACRKVRMKPLKESNLDIA